MKRHPSFLFRRFLLPAAIFFLIGTPPLRADVNHTVKPGESLHVIGKRYHVNPGKIAAANQLSGETIRVGQKLTIPESEAKRGVPMAKTVSQKAGENAGSPKTPMGYKVKKGETLNSIAKKFGLDAEDLKEMNELKGMKLKAGKVIRLRPEEDDCGAENSESEKIATERQETPLFVSGDGFLIGERSRELLGRVAKSFLGFRYTKGGGSVNGMDCSSYVQRVYNVFGIDLPRTAREQFRIGYAVARSALQVGDLVFFKRAKSREPTHVGIYLGDNKYIHTSLTKRQVEIDNLDGPYAKIHFIGAKRIEEVEAGNGRPNSEGE